MIVYDGLKTDFLSSCERDSIAIEIEENILAKLGKHTPKAEFRSWENSLNYMYKVLNDDEIPSDAGVAIEFNIPQTSKRVDFMISGYGDEDKTPKGMPTGSFGPTTANRMDPYVMRFQSKGASMIMVAKGNRSQDVTDACKKYGGFFLGSIGGPAAILAEQNILSNDIVAFPELGMEAIRKITIKDFPAFILVDDKGNNFFEGLI